MLALHAVHSLLAGIPGRLWVDFESEIDPSADIRPGAYVAPKNVRIGRDAVVMAGAVVHERTSIGEKTRIHSSAVIGAEAYEIIYIDGRQTLRPQTGGVWIEDSCEVLSGTTITRAAFCGATTLESWSVLDCNVTVSHDTLIGSNVRIGGSSWIGGRVTIDDGAVLGPNCTVANGISIGQSARVSLGSVVTRNVEPLGHVSGNFAIPHKTFIENIKKSR
jgi:UDP-3-O-[3-hydroxymyristoyl] glucosamine N-acyltransferase